MTPHALDRGRQFVRAATLAIVLVLASTPAGSQTIYAVVLGTQKLLAGSSTLQSGLFVSRDAGQSWNALGQRNVKGYSMDAVDSARGRILFLAAGNGVHRSTDYGASWKIVTGWQVTEVLDVFVDQTAPRHVFAATASGLWCSSDGGDSWSNPPGALRQRYVYGLAQAAVPGTIIALSDSAVYISADRGATWRPEIAAYGVRSIVPLGAGYLAGGHDGPFATAGGRVATGAGADTTGPIYAIAATDTAAIAVGKNGVWRRDLRQPDARWTDITANLPSRVAHALIVDGDFVMVGMFGSGIYRLQDGAWRSSGLEGAQVWSLHRRPW